MWNYEKYESPFKKANIIITIKMMGYRIKVFLYRQKGLSLEMPEVFIDPNTMSKRWNDRTGECCIYKKERQVLCLPLHKAGSDWQEAYVMEEYSQKKLLKDEGICNG